MEISHASDKWLLVFVLAPLLSPVCVSSADIVDWSALGYGQDTSVVCSFAHSCFLALESGQSEHTLQPQPGLLEWGAGTVSLILH